MQAIKAYKECADKYKKYLTGDLPDFADNYLVFGHSFAVIFEARVITIVTDPVEQTSVKAKKKQIEAELVKMTKYGEMFGRTKLKEFVHSAVIAEANSILLDS